MTKISVKKSVVKNKIEGFALKPPTNNLQYTVPAQHNHIDCGAASLILPYLKEILNLLSGNSPDRIIDEVELCKLLNVSHRTAQRFRNQGLRFSQPTSKKIYYRLSWVQNFIEQHSKEGF